MRSKKILNLSPPLARVADFGHRLADGLLSVALAGWIKEFSGSSGRHVVASAGYNGEVLPW